MADDLVGPDLPPPDPADAAGPGVPPQPGEAPRVDLDPALVDIAHPTEAERIRRGALLGVGFGVLLLVLARRRRDR
jgi:hypothetical protein